MLKDDSKPLYHNSSLSWTLTPCQQVRKMITPVGGFIEVYLWASLTTCGALDVKGLYAKTRLGELKHFTDIDEPYEAPQQPEINLDTSKQNIAASVKIIEQILKHSGYMNNQTHAELDTLSSSLPYKPLTYENTQYEKETYDV